MTDKTIVSFLLDETGLIEVDPIVWTGLGAS